MKTIFIYSKYNDFLEDNIKFFVKEGDYQHLNKIYIGISEDTKLVDELSSLIYNAEMLNEFPCALFDGKHLWFEEDKIIVVTVGLLEQA